MMPSSSSSSSSEMAPHILVFPYPGQGHMLPLLQFTHHLALRGLTITLVTTPKNLPFLTPLLSSHSSSIDTLVLPFPSHPSLPIGVENVKDIGNHGNAPMIAALSSLSAPISLWFRSHPSPPVAILSDFFLGWTQFLADQLVIPRIAFYSSGAFLASVMINLWPKVDRLTDSLDSATISLDSLPDSPSFLRSHLPSALLRYDPSDPTQVFVKQSFVANYSSWGFVFNSFDAVEHAFIEHVRRECSHARVWAVGPVSALNLRTGTGLEDEAERGGRVSVSASDVYRWLDGCADGTVVYVCFGSQVVLTRRQVEVLAGGLEQSGTRFILVIKQKESEDDTVPHELEDRVAGRGLVIRGWAPQVGILSHRAVGGFLTHCGWNSVLEGLVAGVVLLAWPMEADQFINAKLLVEYLGVAVKVCEGKGRVPDSGELGRFIAESMDGTRPERLRAMELKEEALSAVKEGGSSARGFDALLEKLKATQTKKRNEEA